MVVLGTTIHEFRAAFVAWQCKLVDGRTKSDHDGRGVAVSHSSRALVTGNARLAQHQVEPDQEHRHAQDLAPGDEIVGAETHFRLAEDLTDRTRYCIADHEKARQHSETLANPLLASGPEQEGEQQDAFQPRLIQLAGVARLHVDMRKDDGPGHVGRPANQLAIHEICDPAEEQADRRRSRDQIAEREGTELLAARIQHDRDNHADEPAMERHAALPDLEDLEWIVEVEARLPEQHLSQPAADDDSDRDPEHQIIELRARDAVRRELRQPDAVAPGEQDAKDVGQRVPSNGNGADLQRDRIELWKHHVRKHDGMDGNDRRSVYIVV